MIGMVSGIVKWGAYIPTQRLDRAAIAAAHAWMAPSLKGLAQGQRAYCNWDEDSITMAVEATRNCLDAGERLSIGSLSLATTTAPFADLQASAIIAVGLRLNPAVRISDCTGSQRVGVTALTAALATPDSVSLVVGSDRPQAQPASVQEMQYGAGAAAFLVGTENVAVELIGSANNVSLFVDHYRSAAEAHDYYWEERWIRDEGYTGIGAKVVAAALKNSGIAASDVSRFIFPAPIKRAAEVVAKAAGISASAVANDLSAKCGYAGSAHALLMLADVLDRAEPGEIIVVAGFGQGCEVLVLRTTDAIVDARPARKVADLLDAGVVESSYLRMASFYGEIKPDWGMRAERSAKTALTEQYRSAEQIYGFVAGQCGSCNTVQFPQLAYCVQCGAPAKGFSPVSLADVPAHVHTYTADWLTYCPAPPLYMGFAQFENGARLLMEFVGVDPSNFDVGTQLSMRFRIKEHDAQRNYDRYFWKAAPAT